MMVGREYPPFSFEVEKGRIRAFAHAIGEDDPIYRDEAAARAAGYRSLPAPPTFAFAIVMECGQGFIVLDELGIDKRMAMHAEQGFTFHRELCAGDTVTGRHKVVEMIEKKGGALQFITSEIRMQNQHGEPVCDLRMTVVVRRPQVAST